MDKFIPLLDPANNNNANRWGAGDCFDALEVRSAFLRFFVALFIQTDEDKATIEVALSTFHASSRDSGRDSRGGRRSSMVDRAKDYVSGAHQDPTHGIEPFFLSLLQVRE